MDAEPTWQSSARRDDASPSAVADPRVELVAVLDELELQVHEDMLMLADPIGGLLAPELQAAIRNSTDKLVDALARTRKTLAAADATGIGAARLRP